MRHLAGREDRWALAFKERRRFNKSAVVLAIEHARILWALLALGMEYQVAGA